MSGLKVNAILICSSMISVGAVIPLRFKVRIMAHGTNSSPSYHYLTHSIWVSEISTIWTLRSFLKERGNWWEFCISCKYAHYIFTVDLKKLERQCAKVKSNKLSKKLSYGWCVLQPHPLVCCRKRKWNLIHSKK